MEKVQQKAGVLIEALGYIKRFKGKVVVIKYGGGAMDDRLPKGSVFEDINMLVQLGLKIVLVHGGGPMIDVEMKRHGIQKNFIDGLRVTDDATITIVEKVLGQVNDSCVKELRSVGLKADNCTTGMFATRIQDPRLGFVGDIVTVNTNALQDKLEIGIIPVVSSLGRDETGHIVNINADTAATKIAVALGAEKLTILTNVDGVLDDNKTLLSHLTIDQVKGYIDSGVIKGGMIPKVGACMDAVSGGVAKAHLLNGTTMRALLLEIFTDEGIGTEVVQ